MKIVNKKLKAILLLIGIVAFTIPISATIYEDAEDNTTISWRISGDTTDATIENVFDRERGSQVIKLTGNGKKTSYRIGNRSGRASYIGAWHNGTEKVLKWSMKYNEPFRIYIPITTEHGNRYLTYTNQSVDAKGKIRGGKVNYGLGTDSIDGTWHTFTRDLEADWNEFMPNNHFVSVNGFFIKGSGYIDDIMSLSGVNPPIDTTKPVITLLGDTSVTLNIGDTYTDAGATATDDVDGNITANIKIDSNVNTNLEGNYTVTYDVNDSAGNVADTVTRKVNVVAKNPILLTINEPLVHVNCLGHITKSGIDTNSNGVLDTNEVTSIQEHYDEGTPITREALMEKIGNGDDVTQVNTCKITDMSNLFNGVGGNSSYTEAQKKIVRNFNQDISGWNTSSVTNMSNMFQFAKAFNQPLDSWNVANVTNMNSMFDSAKSFNQPLDSWDVSNVINMRMMFFSAEAFNQPLENWNVSSVIDMGTMFQFAKAFNQPLNSWNVSHVTEMHDMFDSAKSFNQPLNSWDVSNVREMQEMFHHAIAFNQPLDRWDVSSVQVMNRMFRGATSFNQDISNWDVSNVNDHDNFAENSALENAHNPFYEEAVDTTKPVITLLGDAKVTLTIGDTYTDAGATATDDVDGNITSSIQVTGLPIDTSSEGNYTVTYNVSDSAGNEADTVTRNVNVVVAPKHNYKVTLKTTEKIAGYEIHLKFTNNTAIESDVVMDNSFLGTTGRNVMNLGPDINSTTKEIKFGGFTFGEKEGVVGDFDIMTLKSADSQSQITVSYKSCIDKDANEIVCDIEIGSN